MEWPIQEIARLSGLTSRTLRYFDRIDLLKPSRVGTDGTRHYDEPALLKLQDILLFRRAGVPLKQIEALVREEHEPVQALHDHLQVMRRSKSQQSELLETVNRTLMRLENNEQLLAHEMLRGFEMDGLEEEAVQRWSREAYDEGQRSLEGRSPESRARHLAAGTAIAQEFATAWESGAGATDSETQAVVRRHYNWVAELWQPGRMAYKAVGAMYRDDPQFAGYYSRHVDGVRTGYLQFLVDAISHYADRHLA